MLTEQQKKERAKLCQNCYFCQTDVDKTVSVDDRPSQPASTSQARLDELCRNCYRCETDVDRSLTPEQVKAQRASKCQNCFSCETDVDKSITADNPQEQQKSAEQLSREERIRLCQNCFTCEQGVSKDITADDRKPGVVTSKTPFCWYIFPTNSCNLRCKYCYANNKPGKMTTKTAHQSLHWLFEVQPYKNITCHFFGGEPTTMWDSLVDIVTIGNQMAQSKGIEVRWSMTTNGTLLTPEKLDWIAENFKDSNPFLLSIDGRPETHDKYRVDVRGRPTHHLIPVDEILKRFPNIECRPTIKPDTAKDWFEDFRWLRNKGFKSIAIEPDYEDVWSEEQMRDYENLHRLLGEYYIYAVRAQTPIYMKWIENVKSQLNQPGMPQGMMCGTANNCGAIDHRGKLYACQRYASYNEPSKYAIGDVWNGWDELSLLKTRYLLRQHVHGDLSKGYNCDTCSARFYCMKGCNAANIKIMGSRHIALPFYCELTRIEARIALEVLAELGELSYKTTQGQQCQGSCKL